MNPYNFSVLFFAFCSFILALIVFLKRGDSTGKIYLIYSTSISLWGICYAILESQNIGYPAALFMGRLTNAFGAMIPATWYHFTSVFTGQTSTKPKFLRIFFYGFSLFIFSLAFQDTFIPSVRPFPPFPNYPTAGPLFIVFTVYFFFAVTLGFLQILNAIYRHQGDERKKFKAIFIVAAFGFGGGSFAFAPVFDIHLPQYGIFVMPLYPIAMAYFMTKDKIFDEEEFAYAAHRDKLAAMGILAASINHEIKSPLYVIQNFAENYLDKEKSLSSPDEIKHYVRDMAERIKSQSARASEIVQRLSAFAKVDMIKEVYLKPVRLTDVLANILPLIRYEFKTGNVTFVEEISSTTPSVLADRRCLEQVFFNLLINAYQAIHQKDGEKIIKVAARENNDFVEVAVSDNGPGISPAQQAQIFKPFYTTKEKGSGLGLYVTKQLVEKMKGKIRMESSTKGTTFILNFPKAGKS